MINKFGLFLISLILFSTSLFAQRVNYASLANRSAAPKLFIDQVLLPSEEKGKVDFGIIFRMDNNFIPFKKINFNDEIQPPNGEEFYSIVRLNSELFEGRNTRNGNGGASVTRDLWQDTVFAATFEDTETNMLYTEGMLLSKLTPGAYNFILQLTMMNQSSERNSSRQNFVAPDFSNKDTGEIHLVREVGETEDGKISLPLLNMGNNVVFGSDFHSLIRIPKFDDSKIYSISVKEVQLGSKDTTIISVVHSYDISDKDLLTNTYIELSDPKMPTLVVQNKESEFSFALVLIPNATFENSAYKIELIDKSDENKVLASRVVQSYWANMPPSLFNLDMSISMLKFVVSESQLKELQRGSSKEKQEKFKSFWEERDPTPNTFYNELMTEYYRRVDYAFKTFRNPQTPDGFDTDQGKIYIQYGPPSSTDRSFPERGKALEKWTYPNRTFLFEKGSGYSEFKLIATE